MFAVDRRTSFTWLFALVALGAIFGATGWVFLETLPSRYLAQLPQFVQTWVIPEPESAILPAADVEVDTSALLRAAPTAVVITAADARPDAPAATEPSADDGAIDAPAGAVTADDGAADPATAEPSPTPTVAPTATPTATPPPALPAAYRLEGFTHHQQDWNNCGPATLAMGLSYFDVALTQYDTAAFLKPNEEDRNVSPDQLVAYVERETDYSALTRVNGSLDLLRTLIANDFPVIIEIGLDPPGEVAWLEWYGHYLLVTGYDDAAEELWVFDSLVWDAESLQDFNSPFGRSYPYADLQTYWPHFNQTYVVLYDPAQEATLAEILGPDLDDTTMWQAALAAAQDRVLTDDSDPFGWFNLGTAYTALGDFEAAATAYDKARAIGLPWRMLWYQFGPYEAYYQVGRYIDVILLANTTLNNRPYFEESFYYRGLAQQALGDAEAARESFAAAAEFNPNYAPAQQALAALGN